jgi:hypothetical protein
MASPSNRRSPRFLLAAACALLALNAVLHLTGVKFPPEAQAQTQSRGAGGENVNEPPFNAAADRKRQNELLAAINDRLARVEARLEKGLSVKVTEMPAIKLDRDAGNNKE